MLWENSLKDLFALWTLTAVMFVRHNLLSTTVTSGWAVLHANVNSVGTQNQGVYSCESMITMCFVITMFIAVQFAVVIYLCWYSWLVFSFFLPELLIAVTTDLKFSSQYELNSTLSVFCWLCYRNLFHWGLNSSEELDDSLGPLLFKAGNSRKEIQGGETGEVCSSC